MNANSSIAGHSCCPKNFIDREEPNGIIPGEWRHGEQHTTRLRPINRIGSNNYSESTKNVRDDFTGYFNQEGAVSWQWDRI